MAIKYFEMAGELKNSHAINCLVKQFFIFISNFYYFFEKGVIHQQKGNYNIESAINYYKKAIEMGNPNSMYNLSLIYLSEEKYKNEKEALELLHKAANLDNLDAINKLSNIYQKGDLLEKDLGKAIELLEIGCSLNDPSSIVILFFYLQFFISSILLSTFFLSILNFFLISKNFLLIYYFIKVKLGLIYYGKKEIEKAAEYFIKATNMGDKIGMNNLSLLYQKGEGVERSLEKSIQLLEKSAELGNKNAINRYIVFNFF